MGKTGKIILIVILGIVAFLLALFFILSTIFYDQWGFGTWGDKQVRQEYIRKTETFDIKDINQIDLYFTTSDVKVIFTDEAEGKVIQYSKRDLKQRHLFTIEKSGSSLYIEQGKNPFSIGFLSFGFVMPYYEVYIPKAYKESLSLKTTSSSISIDQDMNLKDVKIETVSGSIKVPNLNAKNIILKSVSGSVKASSLVADTSDVKTTSGSIRIETLEGENTVKSTSGSVRIQDLNGSSQISTTSGSIKIEEMLMENDTTLKSVSGSVSVGLDAKTSCIISTSSVSGSVRIPGDKIGENPQNLLRISTTSGSIRVQIVS